jgi:3'(2'), 5'-bisphosphate nucleotidase
MNEARSPVPLIDRDTAAALIEPLTELVVRAGAAILAVNRGAMRIDGKADGSPVTEADLAADRIIGEGLARLVPAIPAISEERVDLAKPPYDGSFFLIDPLDGTKEFVAGRGEFTVNLALVSNGVPLLGIIGAPALGLIWRGLVGRGAERLAIGDRAGADLGAKDLGAKDLGAKDLGAKPIHTRPLPQPGAPWIVAVSRSHGDARTEAFIDGRPGAVRQMLGSAVKFGRVAEGAADIYPRLAPTCEWDIAAGHAIVTAAGGRITDAHGADLKFGQGLQFGKGRDDFIVPEFIAWGDPSAVR